MKKSILVISFLIMSIFTLNLSAKQNEEVKVVLTFKAKVETKKEFMKFLDINIPNVRSFDGCSKVDIYFDDSTNEMIITENWASKEHHAKYIKFISNNGVLKGLVSFLQGKPSIKYYDIIDI